MKTADLLQVNDIIIKRFIPKNYKFEVWMMAENLYFNFYFLNPKSKIYFHSIHKASLVNLGLQSIYLKFIKSQIFNLIRLTYHQFSPKVFFILVNFPDIITLFASFEIRFFLKKIPKTELRKMNQGVEI